MHRKKLLMSLLIAVFILSLFVSYSISLRKISEKRYNKIMCYYITRRLVDNLDSFEDKISAIRDFVHEDIHPIHGYYNESGTVAIEKLTSGIGWCDQQARVFMQLARSIGITTRLLFLRSKSGDSPHSIAEALAPDNRWVIIDPLYNLHLLTKENKLATQNDIKNDLSIITNNKMVKLASSYDKSWADPEFLSIYYNVPTYVITKKGINFDFLKPVPTTLLRPIVNIIQNKYLRQIKPEIKDTYEFKMIEARSYHLLGYYDKANKLYNEIIDNSTNLLLIHKAEFYYAVSLKDQKKYKDAYDYISKLINKYENNPYKPYLFGLRAHILKNIGKNKESEKDLLEIKYSLETS